MRDKMKNSGPFFLLAAILSLVGCAAPTVTVRHVLPADLPIPLESKRIHVREFQVAAVEKHDYGQFIADSVAKCLKDGGNYEVLGLAPSETAHRAQIIVSGTARIEAEDTVGVRHLRRWNSNERRLEVIEVNTLVRRVKANVTFVVTDARTGEQLAAAETHGSYSSLDDPRARGRIGLGRPDDPKEVTATDRIARELLGDAVETFCRMMEPTQISVDVPLRPAPGSAGREGLAAAEKGDFQAAVEHFKAAVDSAPNDHNLLFNLAVAQERGGELESALANFTTVVENSDPPDEQASRAVRRLKRVLGSR